MHFQGFFSALSHVDAEVVSKWLGRWSLRGNHNPTPITAPRVHTALVLTSHISPAGHEYIYPGQPVYQKGDYGESM